MPGAKLPLLLPNLGSTFHQLYRCPNNCSNYVADDNSTICPSCKSKMNQNVRFVDPPSEIKASSSEEGYVKRTVPYMVMDDLEVKVLSTSSVITQLSKFNVNVNETGQIVVDLGMDEGAKLLKTSLQSKTVLTDVFLPVASMERPSTLRPQLSGRPSTLRPQLSGRPATLRPQLSGYR